MSNKQKKVLLSGSPPSPSSLQALVDKQTKLQGSKAGPFDVCFVVGPLFPASSALPQTPFPIPTYAFHLGIPPADLPPLPPSSSEPVELAKNLYYLSPSCDLTTIEGLVVAYLKPNAPLKEITDLKKETVKGGYIGCDFAFTPPAQDSPKIIPSAVLSKLEASGLDPQTHGSIDSSEFVTALRPRYHCVVSDLFFQSNLYKNVLSSSDPLTTVHHGSRLVGLCSVGGEGKELKWIHAVGIKTVTEMTKEELLKGVNSAVPNPYVSVEPSKAFDASKAAALQQMDVEQYRWAGRGVNNNAGQKRAREEEEVKESDVLFFNGRNKDLRKVLTEDRILERFKTWNITSVSLPNDKDFGFLEFQSVKDASKCLKETMGGAEIGGTFIGLRYGKSSSKKGNKNLTEKDCPDSEVLFYTLDRSVTNVDAASETVRLFAEKLLEDAINGDGASDERITSESEPALKVNKKHVTGKGFGFLKFASHAAAAMAVAGATGSTDGGLFSENSVKGSLFWSNSAFEEKEDDITGLNFQRVHYPADSRTDCWFCLASDSCEKHLIVDVGEGAYVARAKGGVNGGHCIIVPVEHTGGGGIVGNARDEVEVYVKKLREHFAKSGQDIVVFERNIGTKGGYHPHVQCIPVKKGTKVDTTFNGAVRRLGIRIKEIQNGGVGVKTIVDGSDYFYFECQVGSEAKRYVYVREADDRGGRVPIQFGREVCCVAMGCPEKAHWKSCVETPEEERTVTNKFRGEFSEEGGKKP
ncbi:hypothetical protein TrST_g1026 [Triparma strigata]|uniref:RRM domain-containing protein n=1 Tax=Triparma strigata TaxID=1606541 RepID=A0A9W6ZWZ1_9STRA|nr:hypothetical protein TrST_g1026 [Triparma strigata]